MSTTKPMVPSYLWIVTIVIFATSLFALNNPAIAQSNMTGNSSMIGAGNGNGSSNGMNFGSMNFLNNTFNSSSLFGTLGMSMVDGVKVTGINVLQNNDVTVTLSHIITNRGNATLPGPVTVTAIRVPVNIRDLMSIASAAANKTANGGNNNNNMNMMMNPMQGYGKPTPFMSNPLEFLKNIQIGSSNIVNADWSLPQSVTMGLVGMFSSNNKLSSSSPQTADFIIVSVVPFTGKSNPSKF
jgi:hypothetical protein